MAEIAAAADGLSPGFAEPVLDAQRTFRAVLEALAHPGRVVPLEAALEPPAPLAPATAALCLALVDFETPIWLDAATMAGAAARYLRFHCGAGIVAEPSDALFAVVADGTGLPPLDAFRLGSDEFPERSTTLFVQVEALTPGRGHRLSGPGIADYSRLDVAGLSERFWRDWQQNAALFPCGVDVVFTAGPRIAALPRSTRVEG
jgi:alpha-D-ribose 1-methylphosphonate 5-triphosphate synthase subunit PhnH